jgi:hypothetical protein
MEKENITLEDIMALSMTGCISISMKVAEEIKKLTLNSLQRELAFVSSRINYLKEAKELSRDLSETTFGKSLWESINRDLDLLLPEEIKLNNLFYRTQGDVNMYSLLSSISTLLFLGITGSIIYEHRDAFKPYIKSISRKLERAYNNCVRIPEAMVKFGDYSTTLYGVR